MISNYGFDFCRYHETSHKKRKIAINKRNNNISRDLAIKQMVQSLYQPNSHKMTFHHPCGGSISSSSESISLSSFTFHTALSPEKANSNCHGKTMHFQVVGSGKDCADKSTSTLSSTATNTTAYDYDLSTDTIPAEDIEYVINDLSPVIGSRSNIVMCQSNNADALSFSSYVEVFDPHKTHLSLRSKLRDIILMLNSDDGANLKAIKTHVVKLCLHHITYNNGKQLKDNGSLKCRIIVIKTCARMITSYFILRTTKFFITSFLCGTKATFAIQLIEFQQYISFFLWLQIQVRKKDDITKVNGNVIKPLKKKRTIILG